MRERKYIIVVIGLLSTVTFVCGIKFGSSVINTYRSIEEINDINAELKSQIESINKNKLNSNIKITAGHLGDIEGYTLLYKDEQRDLQYLIKNERDYTVLEKQAVVIDGLRDCKICEAGNGYFIVETTTPDLIVNGMSGEVVKDESNKEIGFVIELLPKGQLKCLTME